MRVLLEGIFTFNGDSANGAAALITTPLWLGPTTTVAAGLANVYPAFVTASV
jgi:hypothetical protein